MYKLKSQVEKNKIYICGDDNQTDHLLIRYGYLVKAFASILLHLLFLKTVKHFSIKSPCHH